jgi:K+-sensing histidine kinase KdpD
MNVRIVSVSRERIAVLAGLLVPLSLAAILAPFRASFPNTGAALALVLVIVAVAAGGSRMAGVVAALSSAAWFDFFLTAPYERFAITGRDDIETTVLLLAIGIAVTEIAVWGRRQHGAAGRRAGYLAGLGTAAASAATGESPAELTDQVAEQLTRVLSLRACRYQDGVAGIGTPSRLLRDGRVVIGEQAWNADRLGLPQNSETELLVEAGGILRGRFLLTPGPGTCPGLEQRLVAVALADQAGAALPGVHLAGHARG